MVADPHYSAAHFRWPVDRGWRKFCSGSIYLYTLLKTSVQLQDRYKTILVIVTGLLAIAWIFDLPALVKISLVIGAVSIFIPPAARVIEWAWFKIALGLGWVNSRILLSIIYFVFLMPIAWLSKLFTKDPLALKKDKRSTLFVTRDHLYTGKDLENIW